MAVDLTGIRSENEFYTQHYLAAIFEGDLAEWRTALQEQAERQPHEKIRGLSRDFNKMRDEWQRSRNVELRLNEQRTFLQALLSALGYESTCVFMEEVESGQSLPAYCEVKHGNGTPWLWIMEAFDATDDGSDLLELPLHAGQLTEGSAIADAECNWADYASLVFSEPEPPRWLILAGHTQVVLLDRSKWNAKRLLRFDLAEIYSRKDISTFQAMSALLARTSLCPPEGDPLLDKWDENSHNHALGVSKELKVALREAIELLGNEVVRSLKQAHERVYDRQLADQLSIQSLRFMYRILFLLYVESRPELEYVPVKSRTFLTGYSLDSLRNLEMVQLTTEEARNGTYFHETLKTLFRMIYHGFPEVEGHGSLHDLGDTDFGFTITPLAAHLFDPERTPLINRARLSNAVMQRIIQLMSLSREEGNGQRGRISYAQLGINQLGAVYESLLSYRGFFAEKDLYEVKKTGTNPSDLEIAYFVTEEQLNQYDDDEKVYVAGGARLRKHPRGEFIYRLAGRDRQTSASYYTPEVLTQCLVKYSLKELLSEKTADEILELTVCEPAMGSAAFLNEAVNQLAEAYIERKEKETGESIPHNERTQELQKVKMFIADRNVYGVDLNPIAVELAEVSLWLNTIYKGAFVPWFGRQLHCGNSLIGARRQVFAPGLLRPTSKTMPTWMNEVPARVMPDAIRESGTVYHFLTPDTGMANYTDKVIKELRPEEIKLTKDWAKEMKKSFTADEVKALQRLSDRIDELWKQHTAHLQEVQRRTSDAMSVFGHEEIMIQPLPNQMKDKIYREEVLSENIRRSSPYRRLKLVMDYWCALWFWPIEKAEELPTRSQWLMELSLILEGNVYDAEENKELSLFPETMPKEQAINLFELGGVNLSTLCEKVPRLTLVNQVAEKYRFLHWELEFADIFAGRGGFDLVLGNPPWIKVEWDEADFLSDADPQMIIRGYGATEIEKNRPNILCSITVENQYLFMYEKTAGSQNYYNGKVNFPLLLGVQSNLYKCFIVKSWLMANKLGIVALLHPDGIYDDANGSALRKNIYSRLKYRFGFRNEKLLFIDVGHTRKFSINVYSGFAKSGAEFVTINEAFHPKTIDESFGDDGRSPVPEIKNLQGQWNLKGHKSRLINVADRELKMFNRLFGDNTEELSNGPKLPSIYSVEILSVLEKFSNYPIRISNIGEKLHFTRMWDETNSVRAGILKKHTAFCQNCSEMVISGPHFYIANPFSKTPRQECINNKAYDTIDLMNINTQYYYPRANFFPAESQEKYKSRFPLTQWSEKSVLDEYKVVFRRRLDLALSRSLISAIFPPGVSHIDTVISIVFQNSKELLEVAGTFQSIISDFYVKALGKSDLRGDFLSFPKPMLCDELAVRIMVLNCLTRDYENLWHDGWSPAYKIDSWTKKDQRLSNSFFIQLESSWKKQFSLLVEYCRRQALIEVDVLIALSIGLNIDELIGIYRLMFPSLKKTELDTWYDANGRVVFIGNSQNMPGVGLDRQTWEGIREWTSGEYSVSVTDDTQPGGPVERTIAYVAPFDRCDREEDYRTAWAEFERRKKEQNS